MALFFLYLVSQVLQSCTATPVPYVPGPAYLGSPGPATFDYIVIGAGAAGLTMAARLAEQSSVSVAVIEAGDFAENSPPANISEVPGYGYGVSTPYLDWGFKTVPQAGAADRRLDYSRGKAVGGSTVTNLMAYHRSTIDAYDRWANLTGDDSFRFAAFLQYYTKSVHYTPPNQSLRAANASLPPLNPAAYSAAGGPLDVTYSNWADVFDSYAAAAWKELGVNVLPDLLSGELIGNQYSPATISPKTQTRSTSRSSYFDQAVASGRNNLKLYKLSLAKKIQFNAQKRATGVLVNTNGTLYTLNARKEVIVSAGVFQTPQLLMVSGVGPKEALNSHNITVIADLEGVGSNMQDHLFATTLYKVDVTTESALLNPPFAAVAEKDFNTRATGILTSTGAAYFGWEKIRNTLFSSNFTQSTNQTLASFPGDWPDYEMVLGDLPFAPDANYVQGIAMLQTASSRGSVSISSSDTQDPPIIDTQTLGSESDQQVMIEALKRTRTFFNTTSARRVVLEEVLPGPSVQSDQQILSYLQNNVGPGFHGACTCSMGKSTNPAAVTDTQGRVFGVKGLRVVDASIFPVLPPGHLLSTIYALAEKIAAQMHP